MTTDAAGVEPLPPAQRTLPAMLRFAAERFGDKPLLHLAGTRWSHREAAELTARRAASLQAAGVAQGERVALLCSNRCELLETFLACGWLGAMSVPLNTASMGPQIAYYLANSGARLLVIEAGFVERLALVDLDNFKLCNDLHGWSAGDAVLTRVGSALQASTRKGDAVARWGGDEFALFLCNIPEPAAGGANQLLRACA